MKGELLMMNEHPNDITPIVKSVGINDSEKILARLCDEVFLKLWAYPNPYRKQAKELCDVLAVFEEHVFIFSIKKISFTNAKTTEIAWNRWKNKAIDESIKQIQKAESWIRNNPEKIFLDAQCTKKFPIPIDIKNLKIHRIVVAFGAEDACKKDSQNNINGSLAIGYADLRDPTKVSDSIFPFDLILPRDEVIHVLDSYNLDIILNELDTVSDLLWYFEAKERAIKDYKILRHRGEQELLANYITNFDKSSQKHYIGIKDKAFDSVDIGEGFWEEFTNSDTYKRRERENEISYLWDNLLQRTLQNALDGTLRGDGDIFKGESAVFEMAKEPRVSRRVISKAMQEAIDSFPTDTNKMSLNIGDYPSFYSDIRYAFLQVIQPPNSDYKKEYRPVRFEMLNIACGVIKNRFSHLKKVIGIAVEPPKLNQRTSEDFILLDCENWTKERAEYYRKENKETGLNFFESDKVKMFKKTAYEFPPENNNNTKESIKIGRNDPCFCRSGKKYKKCCYLKGF